MWLAKNTGIRQGREPAPRAVCAKMGEKYAVGDFEYRVLPHCAPYGIYTKPLKGEDVAVMSVQNADLCMGVVTEQSKLPDLLPGEILLRSSGGASIKLCANGQVLINGKAVT